jgi:hypothetical protein
MRHPSTPDDNGPAAPRNRTRGAIRTHLGRKRTGNRNRMRSAYEVRESGLTRIEEEGLFDRLLGQFQSGFQVAGEKTAEAFDAALDAACDALVGAGEFTAQNGERLRQLVRRDLLHRDHPAMTFRTGDITSAGTLTCAGCGWTIQTTRTSVLPACPQCMDTSFRKNA